MLMFVFLINNFFAQDLITYNMRNLQQSLNNNPARQNGCNVFIGLPILSHFYMNSSMPFTYNDLLVKQDNGKYGNIDDFVDNLKDVNYFYFENQMTLAAFGFRVKKFYFNAGANLKTYTNASFPGSIFDIKDGNYREDGTPISYSNFGMDFTMYSERYLNVSYQIMPELTIGATLKKINGIMNYNTDKFIVNWTTNPEDFAYKFETDFEFRTSTPIKITEKLDSNGIVNGIDVDQTFMDDLAKEKFGYGMFSDILFLKNNGLGVDLGAIYKYDNRFTFSASIIDLGYIKWKTNTKTITASSKFDFDGVDIGKYFNSYDDITTIGTDTTKRDTLMQDIKGTLISAGELGFSDAAYSTSLTTKIYLSANYSPYQWLDLGVLYRAHFWDKKAHSAISLSATTNFGKGVSFATSYSIYNGLANNIGLGIALKLGIFQFYYVMDNIAVPYYAANKSLQIATKKETRANYATAWVKNSKELNLHFGLNILIGCKNNPDYGLLE